MVKVRVFRAPPPGLCEGLKYGSAPGTEIDSPRIRGIERASGGPAFTIRDFIKLESAGGILLFGAAVAAMIAANSPLSGVYASLLDTVVAVQVADLVINKPLLLWVNDGLMALFFFVIGLEVKREILEGELSSVRAIALPGFGALGGMLVPAAIYLALNWQDPIALDGWGIPVATDIAFALGLLSVFGRRIPTPLKTFLLTLAIFDDLAAIVIIAIFYTGDLAVPALLIGATALAAGVVFNRLGVTRVSTYLLVGIVLWVAVLKSGVHATLAGVLIAFCIPMRDPQGESPLRKLEHDLHTPVAFVILPVFAFVNAGLALSGHRPGRAPASRDGGRSRGALPRQADRHSWLCRHCRRPWPGDPAARRDLGADCRRGVCLRNRLHHESVHCRPRLRARQRRLLCRRPARNPRRIAGIRGGRLPGAAAELPASAGKRGRRHSLT